MDNAIFVSGWNEKAESGECEVAHESNPKSATLPVKEMYANTYAATAGITADTV